MSIMAPVRLYAWMNRPLDSTAPKWLAFIGDLPLCFHGHTREEAEQAAETWRAEAIEKERAKRDRGAALGRRKAAA